MKTIGVIGGMSWESTLEYYRIMNETVKRKMGGSHSAKMLVYSFDFDEVERLQHEGNWDELSEMMINAAHRLEKAGADFLVIATNTMHKLVDNMIQRITIPILHIVDVVGEEIVELGLKKVGLLGTKFTMEDGFYSNRLRENFGVEVFVPTNVERDVVHSVIYDELVKGIIKESSKKKFVEIVKNLELRGIQGIILGCTEIPLLINQRDVDIPVFDTTKLHAIAAVEFALNDD
ncbi:MAG TPA: aspartate/glutamate racemase family protein [Thermotogaceae bacterium]|nr:aspartate/glutamate racemase family protein [Thermotogaceae bacterium]